MRISDLKTFVTLADLGSFSEAAKQLHISQPALTRRLQKLEEIIGAPLFKRTTRAVHITPIGQEFLASIRPVVLDTEQVVDRIQGYFTEQIGQLKISCVPTVSMLLFPAILNSFRAQYPHVKINLLDGNMTDIIENISRHKADIGIGLMIHQQPELTFIPLFQEPMLVIMHREHPLATKAELTDHDLQTFPLVSNPSASGNRYIVQMHLQAHGNMPNWFHEAQSFSGVLSLIGSSDALAILPASLLHSPNHTNFVGKPIKGFKLHREIGLIYRRNFLFTAYNEFFIKLVKDWAKQLPNNMHSP